MVKVGAGALTTSDYRSPAQPGLCQGRPSPAPTSDQSQPKIGARLSKFWEAWSEIGADPWVLRTVREGYELPFVDRRPPTTMTPPLESTYPKGSEKWIQLDLEVRAMISKGAIEVAPNNTPGFYSRLFLVPKSNGKWRPIIDLSALNKYVLCPTFKMETPRSILRALREGQWLTSLDLKDAYFHIKIHPGSRHYMRFCHEGTVWQFRALPFGLSTSPRVFTKVLTPVLAFAHLHGVKLHMYLDDWLLNPDSRQEAIDQTSWLKSLCPRLGWVLNLDKSDLVPSQQTTYLGIMLDSCAGLARPSDARVTKWLSVSEEFLVQQSPPAYQWLQILGHLVSLEKLVPYGRIRIRPLQWQLRQFWNQAKDPLSMKVPVNLSSRQALIWWRDLNNIRRGVPLGTVEVDRYLFTDSSMSGWGAHMDTLTASGLWSDHQSQSHINVLELHAVWLGLKAFSQQLTNANVALMCDNTSAIAYLKNQGGTMSQEMCDLSIEVCKWAEERHMTLIPRHLPGHLNVLADALSRKGQILPTEWSMNQTIIDRIFHLWGKPHVDLFALNLNKKLATYISPIPEVGAWKVDSLVQSWSNLYAYAYPPTSLIRASLNKIRTDGAEVILVAPCWPNQEWFPELLDLSVDFPVPLPATRKLLKQTFSHQFHQFSQNLNLHAWRLSADSTRKEAFLKKCPEGSLYQKGTPQLKTMSLNGECLFSGVGVSDLILAHQLFQ